MPRPRFFATPEDFRAWLEANHETASELVVGFHKVGSGKPSLTWPQSVDQALCFGWIDGVRKSLDATSYTIRFSPRKPTSIWSKINLRKIEELRAAGLMRPAGLRAFEQRKEARTGVYSFEQRHSARLEPAQEQRFRADSKAWEFFQSQPPGYRRLAGWWVTSAKKDETRQRRLESLVRDSAAGRRLAGLVPKKR